MRWFTSDTHFFHNKILIYDNRPYKTIEEMVECLILNWNNSVSKRDIVYHLGDFAFGNPKRWKHVTDRLNGNITLVRGNHDLQNGATLKRLVVDGKPIFNDVVDIEEISMNYGRVVLSHYPYKDGRFPQLAPRDLGNWQIHGHVHNNMPKFTQRSINVCCGVWDYFPVSENQINEIMKENS
mgnify:CR=1 FL=1